MANNVPLSECHRRRTRQWLCMLGAPGESGRRAAIPLNEVRRRWRRLRADISFFLGSLSCFAPWGYGPMFLVEVIAKPNCYCTSSAYFSEIQPKLRNDVAKKSGLTSLGNGMDSP